MSNYLTEESVPAIWQAGDVLLELYEVKGVLGEGGMGTVYRVHHRPWDLDLAVKTPRHTLIARADALQNFETEAETWINLGMHPHAVSCFYVRRLGGIPRVFVEYIDGGDLETWIRSGRLYEGGPDASLARILDIAIQVAWGLHFAHGKGLIHQDVKPLNVMMTADGTARVTDFGLARARAVAGEGALGRPGTHTLLASYGGMTPAYCSPEQANQQTLTRRTDVWSWAVSVLEMFTGEVSWPSGVVAGEALQGYLEMGSGDARLPVMPHGLAVLLRRCFQVDQAARPRDMMELVAGLKILYQQATGMTYLREEPRAADLLAAGLNNQAVSLLDLRSSEPTQAQKRTEDLAKKAEQLMQEALQADPHHLEATYNLGLLRWRTARITDADLLQRLREAGTTSTDTELSRILQGLVHQERGDCVSIVELLQENQGLEVVCRERRAVLQWAQEHLPHSGRCLRTFEGHGSGVASVSMSVDGRWALAAGGGNETLQLWEVCSGRCLRTFEGHTDQVTSVCLSGDGRWALSGNHDKTLRWWDVSSGRCLRTFEGHTSWVKSVSLSVDGRWALSGSRDKTLLLWEVSSGRCLRIFEGHTDDVSSVCLSGDGRWALSGSPDKTLQLWDVSSGRCLRTFEGHTDQVTSVCMSGDGRWALSGSYDKTLRLWDIFSGRCLRTFEGHTGKVSSVCLSGDGRWALSGGWDKTLRLWDVSSGRCLRTFEGHTSGVTSVCFSGDGRWALSGSLDKTLRLWFLDWELEERQPTGWHEGARPCLTTFLAAQVPYAGTLPETGALTEEQISRALTRQGAPQWTEDDFQRLLYTLGCAGYGWLKPEGVRRELEKMAAGWQGPPPL